MVRALPQFLVWVNKTRTPWRKAVGSRLDSGAGMLPERFDSVPHLGEILASEKDDGPPGRFDSCLLHGPAEGRLSPRLMELTQPAGRAPIGLACATLDDW